MSEQPTLFPPPALPLAAIPTAQLGSTAARMAYEQFVRSLTYGDWEPGAAEEMGRLLAVCKAAADAAQRMVNATLDL